MLSPVKTETGDFVIAVVRDVTERKKNEEALQKSESQLRSITKSAVDAIIATDVEGKIISWNNGAESIFGYQEKEILEKSLLSLIPKKFRRATEHWLNRYAAKGESLFLGQTVESHGLRKNGEEFPLELSMNTWKTSEGRFYSGIIRDITEQKQVNLELEKARDAALESARLKAEFLANMSHEIRTPMNGVIGMTGLLLDTPLDEVQRDFAETIESSADSLLRIIDDVLDFSKIEAGRLHFENIDFNLGEIIEDRIELQAESAFAKNIELISFIHRDVPQYLCGDPIRIGQVLTNFIGNAIKFTEEGEVTLNVTTESETDDKVLIRFEVKDSGIGISSEAQSKLFQAFTQADGSMTRKYGGTGLGLAISKQLVELMNGEIGVYITPEEGSTFWFTGQFEKQLASIAISPPPYIADLLGAKVLIVDDNQTVRRVLLHQTASWGMIGTEAESADDALYLLRNAAKGKPFDIAILDLTLPQTDGVDLARQIKSDSEIADTNLILLLPGKNTDIKDYRDLDFFTAELHKPIRQAQFNDCLVKVSVQSVEKTTPTVKQKTSFNDNFEAKISSSNIRILVAEDNFISQKVIISQLHRLGYTRINVVSNGLELLEEFKKSEYDIILMDVQMPEMDGFEATSAIRRFERDTKYTPIIAITAHIFEGERDKCLKAGMDDYLGKPFKIKILSHLIEKWTKKEFSMQ